MIGVFTDDQKRLFAIADEIASRHAKGWLKSTYVADKIRLRTEIWDALLAEARRSAPVNEEKQER